MDQFDYVIVGAGSAGCVLAARLSEDGRHTVALIEAGGRDDSFWFRIPVGYAKSYFDPRVNWMYSTEPEAELGGRRLYAPRGKVQGGSGAINAMVFVRGDPADFDDWAAAASPDWRYEALLPYFRRLETHAGGASHWHGGDGPIHVTPMRPGIHPVTQRFLEACRELQLPETDDFNGARFEGAGVYDVSTRRGRRSSSSAEYLRPALGRANLAVLHVAHAHRVLFDPDRRATAVVVEQGGTTRTIEARREVILAAGAVGTPKLLQLSGVGDGPALQAAGLPVLHHLPAVGRHLQDHLCASFYYRSTVPTLNGAFGSPFGQAALGARYMLTRKGPFAMSVNQAGAFLRSGPESPRPNIQLYFNPLSYRIPASPRAGLKPEPYPGFLLAFNSCRPRSRGSVMAAGPDPHAPPLIQPNSLTAEHDRLEAVQGARLARRIMAAPALRAITAAEMPPVPESERDADLLAWFRAASGSIYHLCGSCSMGTNDATSVVAPDLLVHGCSDLRVADASVFPNITAGNINAPVMMLAERAADLIRSRSH
jgi:choline dehydrogenase